MDRRERYDDPLEAARTAQDGAQAQMWTALPGIVQSFDAGALTVSVQPAIQGRTTDRLGVSSNVNLPMLVDVPVVFPRGGGVSLTFPVKAGDECLVVFTSRCMDGWWQDGGVKPALDRRMHDLSDGMAILGPWSQKTKIGSVSTTAAQLRSEDGATLIELASGHVTVTATTVIVNSTTATINASGTATVKAAAITLDGPVSATSTITAAGAITGGTVVLQTHVHTASGGSGIGGPPKP